MKKVKILLSFLVLFPSIGLSAQDWKDGYGVWPNDDGGTTYYLSGGSGNPEVVVTTADEDGDGQGEEGYTTSDEGEMRKALEAAEEGETYTPERSDQSKWEELGSPSPKLGPWQWLLSKLGLGRKEKEGIVDGCDPTEIDDFILGKKPNWGGGIWKPNHGAPRPLRDPSGAARQIVRTL